MGVWKRCTFSLENGTTVQVGEGVCRQMVSCFNTTPKVGRGHFLLKNGGFLDDKTRFDLKSIILVEVFLLRI